MTKTELRKIYLHKLSLLSPQQRSKKSSRISDKFFAQIDLAATKTLHCFISIEKFNEVDTTPIFRRLWMDFPQITTVVPRVEFQAGAMQHLKFTPDTELVKNIWDIHEPKHDEYVAAGDIDLVVVPLLSFDKSGHRVGYGKGFYDKFLSECRPDCLKVGLSYFDPVNEIGDAGDLDIRLDRVVTPDKTYLF